MPTRTKCGETWLLARLPQAMQDRRQTQMRLKNSLHFLKGMNGNKDGSVGRTLTFLCARAGSEGHHLWAAEDRLRRGVWAQQQRQHGETQVHVHPRLQEAGLYCEFGKKKLSIFFCLYQMCAESGRPHAATGLCLHFSAGHLSEPAKIILTGMDFAFSEAWTISWLSFFSFLFWEPSRSFQGTLTSREWTAEEDYTGAQRERRRCEMKDVNVLICSFKSRENTLSC